MYCGTDENITVFSFSTDNDECDKWIWALPNTIIDITKYIGVSEKHWPTGYEKIRKKAATELVTHCLYLNRLLNHTFHKH